MKAIETRYAGCHFRSRIEARWAVFFDALGLPWEYEPQGFELPADDYFTEPAYYLPDFFLPNWGPGRQGTWWEVKGASPTKETNWRRRQVTPNYWMRTRLQGLPGSSMDGAVRRDPQ